MGNTWKVVVAFVGVFIAGTVFGGFFALGVGQRMIQTRRPTPPADPMLLQRYVELLSLTPDQSARIKPILEKVQSDVSEIRRQATIDTAAVLKPILEKTEDDLKKILTPEQSAKLGDLQKNRALNPDFQSRGRGGPPQGNPFNRGGGQSGFSGSGGPGSKGPRGPGNQGGGNFNPGGSRGGFPGQAPVDPKTVPSTPVTPAAPAP